MSDHDHVFGQEKLAWRGETGLLFRAVTAAWPSYLAGEGGFMGGVVENLTGCLRFEAGSPVDLAGTYNQETV